MADVLIVDYGVGNVGSLVNMFRHIGKAAELSGDPEQIASARRVLLPGVGHFDHAAIRLRERGLVEPLVAAASSGTPFLGVCLGMQLLLNGSDEGVEPGLGLIPGHSVRFPSEVDGQRLVVPHMGWNTVTREKASVLDSLGDGDRYYFVHSYFVVPDHPGDTLGVSDYGTSFASAIERDNVIGVQFHPEKSHRYGLRLLTDFVRS